MTNKVKFALNEIDMMFTFLDIDATGVLTQEMITNVTQKIKDMNGLSDEDRLNLDLSWVPVNNSKELDKSRFIQFVRDVEKQVNSKQLLMKSKLEKNIEGFKKAKSSLDYSSISLEVKVNLSEEQFALVIEDESVNPQFIGRLTGIIKLNESLIKIPYKIFSKNKKGGNENEVLSDIINLDQTLIQLLRNGHIDLVKKSNQNTEIGISLYMLQKNGMETEEFIRTKESIIIYSDKKTEIENILNLYSTLYKLGLKKPKTEVEIIKCISMGYKFVDICEEKQSNLLNNSMMTITSAKTQGVTKFDTLGLHLDVGLNASIEHQKDQPRETDRGERPTISLKLVSPRNIRDMKKTVHSRKVNSEFVNKATDELLKTEQLIYEEEEDYANDKQPEIDDKIKGIFEKFKQDKKSLRSGSLLSLLNFQVKMNPFLMITNKNMCDTYRNYTNFESSPRKSSSTVNDLE